MIVLEGQSALSPFRRERLEARLRQIHPALRIADTRFTYWVEPEPGAQPDIDALSRILQAGTAVEAAAEGAVSRFVVPRLGTISPWASKATELLHGAGLPVRRVERGTRVDLLGWPGTQVTTATTDTLAHLLHDPMTQSLLDSREAAAALFQTPRPGAL